MDEQMLAHPPPLSSLSPSYAISSLLYMRERERQREKDCIHASCHSSTLARTLVRFCIFIIRATSWKRERERDRAEREGRQIKSHTRFHKQHLRMTQTGATAVSTISHSDARNPFSPFFSPGLPRLSFSLSLSYDALHAHYATTGTDMLRNNRAKLRVRMYVRASVNIRSCCCCCCC